MSASMTDQMMTIRRFPLFSKKSKLALTTCYQSMVTVRQLRSIESWGRLFGTMRNVPKQKGLEEAIQIIPKLRKEFWQNLSVPGKTLR